MIYFDNSATSKYKPKCVVNELKLSLLNSANPGRSSHFDAIIASKKIQNARDTICDFVNAKEHNVIFTKNCTEALNLAILGTAKLGGHVITTAFEHNSVLRPLVMLEREGLISLTIIQPRNNIIEVQDVEKAICDKTYLIILTGMSNVTGYIPPIMEIGKLCKKRKLLFAVDGAQALGHYAFDMQKFGIDLLASAGHKGLHGPQGTGFLIYKKNVYVNPLMYGGTGTESLSLIHPTLPPESLEAGTLNYPGISALAEGVKWTEKNLNSITAKYTNISEYIQNNILPLDSLNCYSVSGSGIVSFDIDNIDSGKVADCLNEDYGIAVRYGLHCTPLVHKYLGTDKRGLVRVSVGYCNTFKDAKLLVYAIRSIRKNLVF